MNRLAAIPGWQRVSGARRSWRVAARILWIVVALVLLGWGAKQRFSLPLEPLIDWDGYGYLNPALSKLTGGGFNHTNGREFLYPAFVFLNLCGFGDFHALSIAQHLLGLATAVLMLVAWQPLIALMRADRISVGAVQGFARAAAWQAPAFFMTSIFLGDRSRILIEHSIRPEAIFPFFGALSIWLNLRFVRLRWLEAQSEGATWNTGAAQFFVSCVLLLLRPSCAFAAVFANVPLLAALCMRRSETFSVRWRPLALALAGAVLLLFLPEAVLRRGDRVAITLFPSMRLLVHANLVLPQIDDDLASNRPLPYDRARLSAFREKLASALEASRLPEHQPWAGLGFNPDYIYLERCVFEPLFAADDAGADRPLASFCDAYYIRTSLHHPVAMARKIGTQLTFFYSFRRTMHFARGHFHTFAKFRRRMPKVRLDDSGLYPLTASALAYPAFDRFFSRSQMASDYFADCKRLARSKQLVPQSGLTQWLHDLLLAAYLPILLLSLVAVTLTLSIRRLREAAALSAWTTLLIYSYNFGISLTIATVFYLGQERYVEMQTLFTLFSTFVGAVFLIRFASAWFQHPTAPRRVAEAPVFNSDEQAASQPA